MIRSYRDLRVWQAAMDLATATYRTAESPDGRRGLIEQLRRSSASIPANIAEGYGRESERAYVQFLKIARGSLYETETHILLAARVNLVTPEQASHLLEKAQAVSKMLNGLIRSIARIAN